MSKKKILEFFTPTKKEFSPKLDTIFVNKNQYGSMVSWYKENCKNKKDVKHKVPFADGILIIEEEFLQNRMLIEFHYDEKTNLAEIIYGIKKKNEEIIIFYKFYLNLTTLTIEKLKLNHIRNISDDFKANYTMLTSVMLDNEDYQVTANKFLVTMMYIASFDEAIEKEIKEELPLTKKQKQRLNRKTRKNPDIKLCKTKYIITNKPLLKLSKKKRAYTPCDHEFTRRGCLVHYKNGKVGWRRSTVVNQKKKKREKGKHYVIDQNKKN